MPESLSSYFEKSCASAASSLPGDSDWRSTSTADLSESEVDGDSACILSEPGARNLTNPQRLRRRIWWVAVRNSRSRSLHARAHLQKSHRNQGENRTIKPEMCQNKVAHVG